jgi:sec-independent protein translocase protein TatA
MNFGNLGFMEILLILVAVLLLFGAKRLPEIGASFGKSITAFKRGLADAERAVKDEVPKDRINAPPPPTREAQPEEETAEPRRLLK